MLKIDDVVEFNDGVNVRNFGIITEINNDNDYVVYTGFEDKYYRLKDKDIRGVVHLTKKEYYDTFVKEI